VQQCTDRSPIFGALLDAICRNPEDDAPRLVYADACEDERCELIVTQCARAAGDDREELVGRDSELLATHGERWFEALAPFNELVVHRGFVEQLSVCARDLKISDAFAREPIQHLTVDDNPGESYGTGTTTAQLMCALMRPEVARLRRLDLPPRIGRDCLLLVTNAARLANLRTLQIREPYFDDNDFGYFVRGSMLQNLEALLIESDVRAVGTLRLSLSRLGFPRLRRLSLRGQGVANAALLALAGSDAFERLEALDLYDNPGFGREVVGSLLATGRLRSLGLGRSGFAEAHAMQLASAPNAARIVQLDLSDTRVEHYLRVLGEAYLPALRDLDLGANREARRIVIPPFGELQPIYGAHWFSQLETLRLDGRAIGDAGLAKLLSRPLPALRTLTLSNCGLTMDAIPTLVTAELPALEVLDLGDNDRIRPSARDELARRLPVRALRAERNPRIRARSLAPPVWPVR
jgi:uncharacterized protein (TIGR02996 family)